MYEPLPDKFSYPENEKRILDFWFENEIFNKSLEISSGKPPFSFYEGPPTVNGKPGIHHLMARTIKDAVCRYKTMRGYFVRRQAGWDTHGLPVEIAVEKQLGLSDKADVEKYGVEKFNAECKKFVFHNIEMNQGWRELTNRMGYWLDLDEAYITCTNDYVESVWWALKTYFDKGLIYKGFKVVPQSPTIETPLSSHELSLGYKVVRDPNCYIKLNVVDSPKENLKDAKLLVWTTTPWTLFANVALAAGEEIDYVLVKNTRKFKEEEFIDKLILAESRLETLDGEVEIIDKFKGKDFIGTSYEQIFDYIPIDREKHPNGLTVLPGDFVSTEDGSGIVHLAPAFGEDDYAMSRKFSLPFLQPVTPNGHFTEELGEFAGRAVKPLVYADRTEEGSDKEIVIRLKELGKIYRSSNDYEHNYPHCWRTGNPVIYYARESWFIESPKYKNEMIGLNKTINWQPPEIGEGRFGNWLEDVKDWSLSRDRFWGTPIPIWISEDGEDSFAIGSIEELKKGLYEKEDGSRVPVSECGLEIDLHRPFVDRVVFEKNGKTYRRISEIVDVWFDSGSMPFAQMHYPFENKELFEKSFPGDFIAEGIDQTRGWFYTLHNIATALFDKPAYKNIIVNELILDETGVKMSKSKGNVVDPFVMMEKYGADAVRWYLLANNPPWRATLFSENDIAKTVISDYFRSLTNTYAFFALYANIDEFDGTEDTVAYAERPEIDRWVLSRVNSVLKEYTKFMDDYDLTKAMRAVQSFSIYELSNWYVRRNRRRFWKGEIDSDKRAAYQTLREVMMKILLMSAPAAPFLTEDLYRRLRLESEPESIHLIELPAPDESLIDADLEEKMSLAQTITTLARSLRDKAGIGVRRPLSRILVPTANPEQRRKIEYFDHIVEEEINVKKIECISGDTDIVRKSAKPDFGVIGKKYKKLTQKVAAGIKALKNEEIKKLEKDKKYPLNIDGEDVEISIEDVEIQSEELEGWLVATGDGLTVALDTQLTPELIDEGLAREFVNRIQNIRKNSGLEVTDRIHISYNAGEAVNHAVENQKEYVAGETLASSLEFDASVRDNENEIDDEKIFVKIEKAGD